MTDQCITSFMVPKVYGTKSLYQQILNFALKNSSPGQDRSISPRKKKSP